MHQIAVLVLLVALGTALGFTRDATAIVVIAHAGGKAHGPENTLPTIEHSLDVGAPWVEIDVRLTADDLAVLMHDDMVDRTTDGTGAVAALTLAEVKALDAGSSYSPEFAGVQVPTLEEALASALGRGPLLIDMKYPWIGSHIASALINVGASADDILVWTTGGYERQEARTYLPGVRIFEQVTNADQATLEALAGSGVDGVSLLWNNMTQSLVDRGHELGLDMFVWGANTTTAMEAAIEFGVDGIHHTDPQYVLDWLATFECGDGLDNDQDGLLDDIEDPGCDSPIDASEQSSEIECDDGIDNDEDGFTDFVEDAECSSPADLTEAIVEPVSAPSVHVAAPIALGALGFLTSRRRARLGA